MDGVSEDCLTVNIFRPSELVLGAEGPVPIMLWIYGGGILDGVSAVFSVNTLAPYVLTCLMIKPASRLMFMSSDAHLSGSASLKNATQTFSYNDTKVHDVMLANAFARLWGNEMQVGMALTVPRRSTHWAGAAVFAYLIFK